MYQGSLACYLKCMYWDISCYWWCLTRDKPYPGTLNIHSAQLCLKQSCNLTELQICIFMSFPPRKINQQFMNFELRVFFKKDGEKKQMETSCVQHVLFYSVLLKEFKEAMAITTSILCMQTCDFFVCKYSVFYPGKFTYWYPGAQNHKQVVLHITSNTSAKVNTHYTL